MNMAVSPLERTESFVLERLLSREWQRDNDALASFLAISQLNMSAVVQKDRPHGGEAQPDSSRIANARRLAAEKGFKNTLLQVVRNACTVIAYFQRDLTNPPHTTNDAPLAAVRYGYSV